jgi:bifunctional DNA-binding transcriptional regulator/antitoxin component of YhaV-PrlF toxin-antitoxin module
MVVHLTRVKRDGAGLSIFLHKELRDLTGWQSGDRIAVRQAGEKYILERVPLEALAKIRTGEVSPPA